MLTLPKLAIPKPTPVRYVEGKVDIPPVVSGPVNPVNFAPGPGSSSGKGSIPTATPPGFSSPMTPFPAIGDPIVPGTRFVLPAAPQPASTADPGKMSLLSGLGGIVGGIGGFLTGGVGGAITGYQAGTKLLGGGGPATPALPQLPATTGRTGGIVQTQGGINLPFQVKGPGGVPLPGFSPGTSVAVHGHYKKNGQWSNRRRPRMNPMNVRAGRRAANRLHAAEKLFRRFLTVSHPGKPHGRIAPKRRKHA